MVSPILDDRETRSDFFSPGLMRVVDTTYRGNSINLILQFENPSDASAMYAQMAKTASWYEHFALSRKFANISGLSSSLEGAQLYEKALSSMENKLWTESKYRQDEKPLEEGERVASVLTLLAQTEEEAERTAKNSVRDERRFNKALENAYKAIMETPHDLDSFFENTRAAIKLKPSSFRPLTIPLLFAATLSVISKEVAKEGVDEGYRRSAVQTFNYLMTRYQLQEDKTTQALICERFPHDCIALQLESSDKALKSQEAFAKLLENGLNFLLQKKYDKARSQFSQAKHYCLMDKRPYLYLAVLDLRKKDTLSALSQAKELSQLIEWTNEKEVHTAIEELCKAPFYDAKYKKVWQETSLLKSLISLVNSRSKKDLFCFVDTLYAYLSSGECDPIFAVTCWDIVKEVLGAPSSWINDSELKEKVFNGYMLLPMAFFHYLKALDADLSEYDAIFSKEKNAMNISITVAKIESKPSDIRVSRQTHAVEINSMEKVLFDLLFEYYNDFALIFIQSGGHVSDLLNLLESAKVAKLYAPFVLRVINRISEEGNIEEKIRLLHIAKETLELWPSLPKDELITMYYRWYLVCPNERALEQAGETFVVACGADASKNSALSTAKKAWELLSQKRWDDVKALVTPFFDEWEEQLERGADPIAVQMLCFCTAVLDKREYLTYFPSKVSSKIYGEVIGAALHLIARSKVPTKYIIVEKARLKELVPLYLGQHLGERHADYVVRLGQVVTPDLTDLRHTKNVTCNTSTEETEGVGWKLPLMDKEALGFANEFFALQKAIAATRAKKNTSIQNETPKYTNNKEFVDFVEQSDFAKLQQAFGMLNVTEKEVFSGEIESKKEHKEHFQELQKNAPSLNNIWDIAKEVARIIEHVQEGKRSEVEYDMVTDSREDALIAQQLFMEWSSQNAYIESMDDFAKAYHGPEIHVWGKGPRINHFNAGIFKNGKPANMHIFF